MDVVGSKSKGWAVAHVHLLAEDECIRFSCAEVLRRFGFRVSVGPLRAAIPGEIPDAILIWYAQAADAIDALAVFGSVPVLVFSWDRRQVWPDGVSVIPPPFNAERFATALHQAVHRSVSCGRATTRV